MEVPVDVPDELLPAEDDEEPDVDLVAEVSLLLYDEELFTELLLSYERLSLSLLLLFLS